MQYDKINYNIIEDSENCPCGSENKFINCCKKNIDASTRIDIDQFRNNRHTTDWMIKKYKGMNISLCLHPNHAECIAPIISAHALQNNGILSRLAVNNHVKIIVHVTEKVKTEKIIELNERLIQETLLNSSKEYTDKLKELLSMIDKKELKKFFGKRLVLEEEKIVLKYKVEKQGKNEATTFTGFCKYHDSSIFAPIEIYEYKGDIQQNFLFAYRVFVQEYHEKLRLVNYYKDLFRKEPSLYNQTSFVMDYRFRQLDEFYMDKLKRIFDKAINEEDFDIFETIKIELPNAYDFAVSAMITPEIDLVGNMLNDIFSLEKELCGFLYLTIFPTDTSTIVLFSWLKEDSDFFINYKNQILSLTYEELKKYLNNFIPKYTTNIVISPRLWDKQSEVGKREFTKEFENMLTEIEFSKQEPEKLTEKRKLILKSFNNLLSDKNYDLFK